MAHSPQFRYQEDLKDPEFLADPAQLQAVHHLQNLYETLLLDPPKRKSWLGRFWSNKTDIKKPIKGLYFWGGVGRGKTYLVDTFYDCLPFEQKKRMHFHRFMQRIHHERKALTEEQDPLSIIAARLARETKILCFDEFVVNDVADAVILVKLMQNLFHQGVSLVATSNVEPSKLYLGGLQRDLFLPAIDLIYEHTNVVKLDSGIDYRLRYLDKAEIYFSPLNESAEAGMLHNFEHLTPERGSRDGTIRIEGRNLTYVRRADSIIWFTFAELCDGPRSQNDYIELARCFQSILIGDIPIIDRLQEDQARRFINLVDVLYDHNVKLIVSAAASPKGIYQGSRNKFEFQRTISRLQEMQSHDYLALEHKS